MSDAETDLSGSVELDEEEMIERHHMVQTFIDSILGNDTEVEELNCIAGSSNSSQGSFQSNRKVDVPISKDVRCPVHTCQENISSLRIGLHFRNVHALSTIQLIQNKESKMEITAHVLGIMHCNQTAIGLVKVHDRLSNPVPLIVNMWYINELYEDIDTCRPNGIRVPKRRILRPRRPQEWYVFWLSCVHKFPYYFNLKLFDRDNFNFSTLVRPHLTTKTMTNNELRYNPDVLILEKSCINQAFTRQKSLSLYIRKKTIVGV